MDSVYRLPRLLADRRTIVRERSRTELDVLFQKLTAAEVVAYAQRSNV